MNQQYEEPMSTADLAGTSHSNEDLRQERNADSPAASTARRADSAETTDVRNDARMDGERAPLFPSEQAETFKSRWTTIQSGFVDEPRRAVEQADSLIAEVMKSLAGSFAEERETLERQWGKGDDVSTEDLRIGLQRYRSFFDRLLSV